MRRRLFALVILLALPLVALAEPVWNDAYDGVRVASLSARSLLPMLAPQIGSGRIGYEGAGGSFAGGDVTNPIGLPDGSVGAPSLYNTGDTDTGLYFPLANQIGFAAGGDNQLTLADTGAFFDGNLTIIYSADDGSGARIANGSGVPINWSSTGTGSGAADAGIKRVSAGVLGITDGSTGQGNLIYNSLQTSHTKALVDATATAFVRVAVADDDYEGVTIDYTIYAEDADTDARQVVQGMVPVAILNNSGTEACGFPTNHDNYTQATLVTAGTLTVAWDCNSAVADTIDIRATADTSLDAAAETLKIEYTVTVTSGTATVTPQ